MKAAARQPSKLQLHLWVLRALIRREIVTRFGRTAGGYLWAIGEPVGFILVLTLVISQLAHRPPLGDSFFLFFATGYLGFQFYRSIEDIAAKSVQVNRTLLNFPRVTPFDTVIARAYLQLITVSTTSLIVLVIIFVLNGSTPDLAPHYVFGAIAFAALLGLGVGSINAIAYTFYPVWERVFGVINRPLFILSGVFFIPESLPTSVRDALLWNPIVHIIAMFRKGFYPEYGAEYVSYGYLSFLCLITLFIGFYLLHHNRYTISEQ